jgi:hypothetical protein
MREKIKAITSNSSLITDFLAIFIITFGVILIAEGLFLITSNPASAINNNSQQGLTPQFALSVTNSIPGIPFCISALSQYSFAAIGLVSWIGGLNLLFIGLGLWVRHRLARLVAFVVFALAAFFQFTQFLLLGIVGSPISVAVTIMNSVIAYLLFSKFDFSSPSSSRDNEGGSA